jgi:hypothetical protein
MPGDARACPPQSVGFARKRTRDTKAQISPKLLSEIGPRQGAEGQSPRFNFEKVLPSGYPGCLFLNDRVYPTGDFMVRIASKKVTRQFRTAYRDTVLAGRMIVEPNSGTVHPDAYGKFLELKERLLQVLGVSPTNVMKRRLVRDSLTSAAMDRSNDFSAHVDKLISDLQLSL